MNAIDTNISLYSADRHEPAKQLNAQQLLQQLRSAQEPTYLLWQVQSEMVQQLRRWRDQGKLTHAEFIKHVQALRQLFPLVMPTPAVLDRALDLAERFSVSHWDAMIIGACQEAGLATLYTEDIGAPTTIDRIH